MKQIEKEEKEKNNYPIRELFLREFFARILIYGYAHEITKTKVLSNLKKLEDWKESSNIKKSATPAPAFWPTEFPRPKKQFIPLPMPRLMPPPAKTPIRTTMRPAFNPAPFRPRIAQQENKQEYRASISPPIQLKALAKIDPILLDPSVISIECIGPGKPLSINKNGSIQTSQIILNAEEIQKILQEVSDKTRIPIIPGVFKAVFNNLLLTAVISEYAGTRFVIQKRLPPPNPAGFPIR